jgi:hypothetical protein
MDRLGTREELMSRLRATDPAVGLAPLSDGATSRIIRHAMTPTLRPWSRRRFRLASVGAFLSSGGLVVAGILGIQAAAAPGLPVLSLGSLARTLSQRSTTDALPSPNLFAAATPYYVSYRFLSAPALVTSTRRATAFQLVSTVDASGAARELAKALGIAGRVTPGGTGVFVVGHNGGPLVSTWSTSGVVEWSYRSSRSSTPPKTGSGPVAPDSVGGAAFSTTWASQDAGTLLARLGATSSFGTPATTTIGSQVNVDVPLLADGVPTDQSDVFAYGPRGVLEWASGLFARLEPMRSYPTISPKSAVGALRNRGAIFFGLFQTLLAPVSSPHAARHRVAKTAQVTKTATTVLNSSSALSTPGPPVVINVTIEHATLEYDTYTLTNGTSWLLATWALSGSESQSRATPGVKFAVNVLAVAPRYVRLQRGSLVF